MGLRNLNLEALLSRQCASQLVISVRQLDRGLGCHFGVLYRAFHVLHSFRERRYQTQPWPFRAAPYGSEFVLGYSASHSFEDRVFLPPTKLTALPGIFLACCKPWLGPDNHLPTSASVALH